MLDPINDWPAKSFTPLSSWPYNVEETAAWVQASPCRAFFADGSMLWIARRRYKRVTYPMNMPPDPGQKRGADDRSPRARMRRGISNCIPRLKWNH